MPSIYKFPFVKTDTESGAVDIDNRITTARDRDQQVEAVLLAQKKEEERQAQEIEFEIRVKAEVDARVSEIREGLEANQNNIMFKANSIAETIKADARKDVDTLLAQANVKAHDIRDQAKVEGFKEGYDEGKAAALDECAKYLAAVKKLLEEINAEKDAYYASHEDKLLGTVMTMVEKVLARELAMDKGALFHIAAQAAKSFRNAHYLKVTVAKGEVSELLTCDAELVRKIAPSVPDVELEVIEGADEGTLILDDGDNIVDASLPTQLEFLREILGNQRSSPDPYKEVE